MIKRSNTERNVFGIGLDKSQIFTYKNPDFPAYITHNKMPKNAIFMVTDHWHDEIEFIYVLDGTLKYTIEGETILLNAGEGVMVNARKLHVGGSNNGEAVDSYCVILHPILLSSTKFIDTKYVESIIKNQCIPYVKLTRDVAWQKDILDNTKRIYELNQEEDSELEIIQLFFDNWRKLYANLPHREEEIRPGNHHLVILKDMISFIHDHYKEKIALEDICNSGGVGKTMGTNIFNMYVNKTPGEFLKDYRIQKSIKLLQETDMTVTEICYETGFTGASYFAEIFKKTIGMSPLEYRKEKSNYQVKTHYSEMI